MVTVFVFLMLAGSGAYAGYVFGRWRTMEKGRRDAYRQGRADGLLEAAEYLEALNAESASEGGAA